MADFTGVAASQVTNSSTQLFYSRFSQSELLVTNQRYSCLAASVPRCGQVLAWSTAPACQIRGRGFFCRWRSGSRPIAHRCRIRERSGISDKPDRQTGSDRSTSRSFCRTAKARNDQRRHRVRAGRRSHCIRPMRINSTGNFHSVLRRAYTQAQARHFTPPPAVPRASSVQG